MKDESKTKVELIKELKESRRKVTGLEKRLREESDDAAGRAGEDPFRTMFNDIPDFIKRWLPDGTLTYVNDNLCRYLNVRAEDLVGKSWFPFLVEEDRSKLRQHISNFSEKKPVAVNEERVVLPGGETRWQRWSNRALFNKRGKLKEFQSVGHDITRRKEMEDNLRTLASTDTLTGAYNRFKFYEIIGTEMGRANRFNHPLSMLMFDIDHFKEVNDTHGHAVGDYVLKTIAALVKAHMREIDYLVRWGGEEFIMLLTETPIHGAGLLAERIRKSIENYSFDKVGLVTVSFGVTQLKAGDTVDGLIKRTDDAMYKAKAGGRNRVARAT